MAGSAWESSERSLRHKAEVRVGRRPILPPTQAAGKRRGKVVPEAGALGHFTGRRGLPRPALGGRPVGVSGTPWNVHHRH